MLGTFTLTLASWHVLKELSQKLKVRRLDSTEASWLRFRRKLSSTLQKAFGNECVCHESQLAVQGQFLGRIHLCCFVFVAFE